MSSTTAGAVAALRDAYPRQDFPDRSVQLYMRMLADVDPSELEAAVKRLIFTQTFLPSIAEIRLEVAEDKCGFPTAAEAWTMITQTSGPDEYVRDTLPYIVKQSLDAMGGRFSVIRSERPETIRAQFMRDYTERRDRQLRNTAIGDTRRAIIDGINDGTAVAIIPPTESMQPRPVWARWLERQSLGEADALMLYPTDVEKHDAIAVLEAGGWGVEPLFVEAQRILDDADASAASVGCDAPGCALPYGHERDGLGHQRAEDMR